MLKTVKLLKYLSWFIFLGIFMTGYASLPVAVRLHPQDSSLQVHRETFFYSGLGIFLSVNLIIYMIQRLIIFRLTNEWLQSWVSGFTFVINLYLTILIGFIALTNILSPAQVQSYAYLNFLGPILIFIWVTGLLILIIKNPKTH